ncbi:GAF and ANTAR domain-containing protein [Nocardioides piscis]|uniref:GAF and ANTAR domain-containing protein n=1 Tax=Nocardioides piscis TaxID=2714938 RepID=A0A6G7YEI3_9ACTN|nr:GAF and ANTAR domain-containing protein [Nocardioides piscis]QIK75051.1 GAF and ANTAR domain-containing protein [Nocardioides piscis]
MTEHRGITGLARLSGLLVSEHDPIGIITAGIVEACASVGADAGGVLVGGGTDFEVLAATSHRLADLEAYQAGATEGPCVEAVREHRSVSFADVDEATTRWPGFARPLVAAGYTCGHAVPMTWDGTALGGLNLFWKEPAPQPVDQVLLQAFADILTLATVQVRPLSTPETTSRLQEVLATRSTVEQAKGVLAWQRSLEIADAYHALLTIADEQGLTLSEAARAVLRHARSGEQL